MARVSRPPRPSSIRLALAICDTPRTAVRIPLLHIADVTGTAVRAAGLTRVGLLGTRFTMEEDFCAARLARLGIDVLTPPAVTRGRLSTSRPREESLAERSGRAGLGQSAR